MSNTYLVISLLISKSTDLRSSKFLGHVRTREFRCIYECKLINSSVVNIIKRTMKDEIKFYREIAGKTIKVTKYKFEEVTSHTCRRTFCTLKFLKGMPAQAIMKFTGHTSERNFLKYLKLDAELTAQKYKGYF